jgi:uncharacterized GH25 family protein
MRGLRIAGALAAGLLAAAAAQAHELKVLASRLEAPEPGGKATVYLSWGHRLPVDELVDAAGLERYDLVAPDGTAAPLKKDGLSLQANAVSLQSTGVYQAVVCRRPSVFTYVIDAEGQRQMRRGPKTAVTEGKIDTAQRSRQCGKALIVVGRPGTEPVKPLGLPVEVVPLDPPSAWRERAALRFQVLLEGKPAGGAEVSARDIGFKPDDAWGAAVKADAKGEATVRVARAGTWVIKVSVKRPAAEAVRAQYDTESATATLALEVRP